MVMQQNHQWILLPLAKHKNQNQVHLASEINATQTDRVPKIEHDTWFGWNVGIGQYHVLL